MSSWSSSSIRLSSAWFRTFADAGVESTVLGAVTEPVSCATAPSGVGATVSPGPSAAAGAGVGASAAASSEGGGKENQEVKSSRVGSSRVGSSQFKSSQVKSGQVESRDMYHTYRTVKKMGGSLVDKWCTSM